MLDINFIKDTLQDIVDNNHTIKNKRELKVFHDRISMACTICGDSDQNMNKKRGNLYLNNLRYKCFNCGETHSLLSFLTLFNKEIDPEKRLEMIDHINDNIEKTKWNDDEFVTNNLDKLLTFSELENYFNNNNDSPITNFREITEKSKVHEYLLGRKIRNFENLYEGTYWHNKNWNEQVLILVNGNKDKVLGLQTRNLKGREKRFYKVFPFSVLYKMIHNKDMDELEKIVYDKLSYLHNIMKVDWTKPITIFEGSLDACFFPNSIGCVGTNTDLKFLLNQELMIRFFYDHDKTGLKKTKEKIKAGYSVFLWDKFLETWSSHSKNPYSAYNKLKEKIVDLNDVAKLIENPYKKLNLEQYFSVDLIDIMYIKEL